MSDRGRDELIGRVLGGRYRLLALSGRGASARVYLADDTRLRRQVAVKLLHVGLAGNSTFLRRFEAEARTAAKFSHPNVLAVHDSGEDEAGPFIVTEFAFGGSLQSLLDRSGPVTPSQALLIGHDAARALAYLHQQGLKAHRDVKPGNLLFDGAGNVKVADFGLARALHDAGLTEPDGVVLGTSRYLAPEAASAGSLGSAADVYSLALTLVEAVTGVVPLSEGSPAEVLARRNAVRGIELGPERFRALAAPLSRALRTDPAKRSTAARLQADLEAVAGEFPKPAPLPLVSPVDPAPPGGDPDLTDLAPESGGGTDGATRPPRRWPRRLAAALAVVIVAAGATAAAIWMTRPEPTPTALVPDLIGQPLDRLLGQAETFDWLVTVVDEPFSETVAEGSIVGITPAPGTELEYGSSLDVVVSAGLPPVELDDLTGLSLNAANDRIVDLQLSPGSTTVEANEEVPVDEVLRVVIEGVTVTRWPQELERGTRVDLVVSGGPDARVVPDVRGATVDEAVATLAPLRLTLVEDSQEFSETVARGLIISQAPLPGVEVERDSPVTVVVSRGPDRRAVPELIGLTVPEARTALENVGLRLGSVFGPEGAERIFDVADVSAGDLLPPGTAVDVFAR